MIGHIVTVRLDKKFGFLRPLGVQGDSEDVFFHISALQGLEFGDRLRHQWVEYEATSDPRHPGRMRATSVRPEQRV